MSVKTESLKSRQRARVLDAYRARGRRNNSLWLVYSVKTNRDWLLTSDRQLVHWLIYLESARDVSDFEIEADQNEARNLACVRVLKVDGTRERHIVSPKLGTHLEHVTNTYVTSASAEVDNVCIYTDAELKPVVQLAMRWHKALAYATVLRDQEQTPVRLALIPLLTSLESGTVSDVLDDTVEFDQSLVIGMLVRLAIEGHIKIDLTPHGIAFKTPWSMVKGDECVES